MGKKGGSSGGTTTTKTEPWDGQKEYLRQAMQAAQQLYNGGNLTADNALAPAYYSGNTVAPQSAWTQQALTMQANAAKNMASNPTMQAANTAAQQVASGQALKNNAGLTQLQSIAKSAPVTHKQALQGNAGMNYLNGITGQGINAGNTALTQLNDLATNDNPYMDALYQRANNQAQASLDANFNRAGRYGSGAHEAAAADAANNLANEMYGSLYNQRINAANAASQAYLQGQNEGIAARQAAGSLYNSGTGNLINAYGQQANAAQGAAQAYNTGQGQRVVAAGTGQQLAQQPYTDAAMLSEAGGVTDDYQQQLINAAIDRYNYEVQRPLQALSTYNQLISGNYGGTSTAQGQQVSGSRLGSAIGGGLGGWGLGAGLSGLSGAAALTSPWALGGAAIGGLLGLL